MKLYGQVKGHKRHDTQRVISTKEAKMDFYWKNKYEDAIAVADKLLSLMATTDLELIGRDTMWRKNFDRELQSIGDELEKVRKR